MTKRQQPKSKGKDSFNHNNGLNSKTEESASVEGDPSMSNNMRKEKSLGYLCERFCQAYRHRTDVISIDEASKELNVQRRRMYEILNIMKSVGLVSRIKTCAYKWEGFETMLQYLKQLQIKGPPTKTHEEMTKSDGIKRERASRASAKNRAVATCLSERFIQLFLCNECPQPIILEDVTTTFTEFFGNTSNPVSRGRRLYDIANVFCTLGLICKTVAIDSRTKKRKRLYTWCGPSLSAPGAELPDKVLEPPVVTTTDPIAAPAVSKHIQPEAEEDAVEQKPPPKKQRTISKQVEAAPRVPAGKAKQPKRGKNYVKPPTTLNWYDGPIASASDHDWGAPTETSSDTLYKGALSRKLIDTDSATMESTIALRAELGRLARALKQSEQREHTLRNHIESQKTQITKLIERTPQPIIINSPITNIVFTPYGRNCADKSKRTGPALPSLDTDCSESAIHTTPSSYLIATAASSLLSLTPSKPSDQYTEPPANRVSSMSLPALDSPGTYLPSGKEQIHKEYLASAARRETNAALIRRAAERDSPSQTKYIFGALSPLPNAQVWDI